MKFAYNFLFAVLCIISMASMFAVASEEAEAVTEAVTEDDEAPLRRLVRGRSSVLVDTDEVNERELGRVKPRYDDGIYSSKGSKGGGNGGSTGSKGSKGGSSSVDVGPGSNVCGAGCGEKDFAYLMLKGFSFMGIDGDDSTAVVPIEGTGRLNTTKPGSTIRILENQLDGFAEYFDHGDPHPHKNKITARLTGSCTILDFFRGESSDTEVYVAHCTTCITYVGECCDDVDNSTGYRYLSAWTGPYKKNCTSYGGVITTTGDLFYELKRNKTTGTLISFQDGGLVALTGAGAITGAVGDPATMANGGFVLTEYFANVATPYYRLGVKIPFNEEAACKLQDFAEDFFLF
jgi:hypothetical protein